MSQCWLDKNIRIIRLYQIYVLIIYDCLLRGRGKEGRKERKVEREKETERGIWTEKGKWGKGEKKDENLKKG